MGLLDMFTNFTNIFVGSERVKASKAECKEKKRLAEEKYNEEVKRIDAECEASLKKAKEADKVKEEKEEKEAALPSNNVDKATDATEADTGFFSTKKEPSAVDPNRKDNQMGGKRGKSKKRSKSNRKKTRKH